MISGCGCSEDSFAYLEGLRYPDADDLGIVFLLHRSDTRFFPEDYSPDRYSNDYLLSLYENALWGSQSGQIISQAAEAMKIPIEQLFITNAYKCHLPKDRNPWVSEYHRCFENFDTQLERFQPKGIISFGDMPRKLMFPDTKKELLGEVAGNSRIYNDVPVFINYHPRWIWSMPADKRHQNYMEMLDFINEC